MNTERKMHSSTSTANAIFVIGGSNDDDGWLTCVEMLNTTKNGTIWEKVIT